MHERIAALSRRALDAAVIERLAVAQFDTLLLTEGDDAGLAGASALRGELALWTVVTPDTTGAPVFDACAVPYLDPWLVDDAQALDPRQPPRARRLPPVAGGAALVAAWQARVDAAFAMGVTGFVCRDADRLPGAFWSTLLARGRPGLRWIAWTAGFAPVDVAALVAAGFDSVTSSIAWWDGRAPWLAEESQRLPDVARLAFPIDPFATAGPQHSPLSVEERLRLAAFAGDALLVPEVVWQDFDCSRVNRWVAGRSTDAGGRLRFVSGPEAPVTAVLRSSHTDLRASDRVTIALVNADPRHVARAPGAPVTAAVGGFGGLEETLSKHGRRRDTLDPCGTVELAPGEVLVYEARRAAPIRLPVPTGRRSAEAGLQLPRLAIEAITPSVDGGRFPVKRSVGESVRVEADLLIDGHEMLAAALLYRAAGDRDWRQVRMEPLVNDRYVASFPLTRVGRHEFTIEAWRDVFATYRYELDKKFAAGLDVSLELVEGRRLVDDLLENARAQKRPDVVRRLTALSTTLATDVAGDRATMAKQVAALLSSQTLADLRRADRRGFATRPAVTFPVDAERPEAGFASWYELFPRSLGNPPGTPATHHGTFADVIERLPAVRAMGFDVLYFPPIHPIGVKNRKGRNNSLVATADDPGSPYAIGSADGGHDALHPELGTFDDFRRMRDAALENGLELALDFAIQCAPDHPWLKEHPGWFAWRPDGSLRYAENPPKKYEDIVNVDFYGQGKAADSPSALWAALRDVILLWVEEGVRIFRVDNPHTKPLPFWEWMIGEVRARYPDTIFLSEAFTRPKVMYRLAKVGFSQSYTYFTWRHTKDEFIEYLTELTAAQDGASSPRDFFRPNFFVNTPDINPVFLQRSGRAGFLIRAALAATLSGLWGVYSGFELCEATPVPGKEDYLDSEKYQLRAWDWQRPGNIVAEITALNRVRRENPALRTHLNIRFENVFDPNLLYFSKATEDRSNIVLVAINLDPHGVHEADFEVPLWQWGLPDDATVAVTDLLDGHRFQWHGKTQRMRLDPGVNPYALWRVTLRPNGST